MTKRPLPCARGSSQPSTFLRSHATMIRRVPASILESCFPPFWRRQGATSEVLLGNFSGRQGLGVGVELSLGALPILQIEFVLDSLQRAPAHELRGGDAEDLRVIRDKLLLFLVHTDGHRRACHFHTPRLLFTGCCNTLQHASVSKEANLLLAALMLALPQFFSLSKRGQYANRSITTSMTNGF